MVPTFFILCSMRLQEMEINEGNLTALSGYLEQTLSPEATICKSGKLHNISQTLEGRVGLLRPIHIVFVIVLFTTNRVPLVVVKQNKEQRGLL